MALTKAHNRMIEGAAVNVKDFGATGDGVTDDTAAIQAAINSLSNKYGGQIYFPPGQYLVTDEIVIDKQNCSLRGELQYGNVTNANYGGSYILLGATLDSGNKSIFVFTDDADGDPTRGCSVVGLSFNGNGRSYDVLSAVEVFSSDIFNLKDCQFRNIKGSAITFRRSIRCVVSNIDTKKCGDTGKPTFDIQNADTLNNIQNQGNYSNMMIEANYNIGLYIGTSNVANHFTNVGFETDGNGTESHLVCAGERNLFSNIQLFRNSTATTSKLLISGDHNAFSNVMCSGDANTHVQIELTGNQNIVQSVIINAV